MQDAIKSRFQQVISQIPNPVTSDSLSLQVAHHSNIVIGADVFIWGGRRTGIPELHVSSQKRQFTSSVSVYNILQPSLDTRQTTGTPPNGTLNYSSCCIGEDIYYFGGSLKIDDCYQNNLFVLNTKSYKWREVDCDNGPMKKANCEMIHLVHNGEDYLLVIGGYGLVPAHETPDHYKYPPHKYAHIPTAMRCYTNEVHIMCVSSTPGKWTIPMMTGTKFPPLAGFSINTLPGNRAIIFGGYCCISGWPSIINTINDVFILTYYPNRNSLNIQALVKPPSDPSIQWPIGRSDHSSVIITSVSSNGERKNHLLVMGGWNNNVIPDAWILSIDKMKWNKIVLPDIVCGRYGHSMTSLKMSMNCVWLFITGGVDSSRKYSFSSIVELVFFPSVDTWRVSKVVNEEDMKQKQYSKMVSDRLAVREKEYQLMMESTVPATTEPGPTGGGEEQVELLKQQMIQKDEQNCEIVEEMQRSLEIKDRMISDKEGTIQSKEELLQDTIRQKDYIIQQKEEEIQDTICQKDDVIQQKEKEIQDTILRKDNVIQQKEKEIQDTIRRKDDIIHKKEEEIRIKNSEIQSKIDIIRQKDDRLQQNHRQIQHLQSQLESRPWVIQDEEVDVTNTIIGGGAYGEVRVAVFRGARVAAKLLHELIVSDYNKDVFTREMEISSGIHHPNIVQFIGATRINNPILLYELMPTSLHKRLQAGSPLTHAQIVSIGCDICTAMCYLHQWRPQAIIHRDISSPNVLMEPLPNDKWRAKLSDFGSANLQMHIKTVIPGNPAYAAPEALIPQHHSPAMDVYSLGVLLTEMTLHRVPEMDSTRREQSAHGIDWEEMRAIVLKCINNDRSQRLSSVQLLTVLQKL